jgi:hypothetical protein
MNDLAYAEAAYVDACRAGDVERVRVWEAEVDRLDPALNRKPVTTLQAALWYAGRNLKVFPLVYGRKVPHKGTAGFLDATTDADQVRLMWQRFPGSNVGIATGHLVDVIDIDGSLGVASMLKHWDLFQPPMLDVLGVVSTPRPGGRHLYIAATGRKNGQKLAPGVDFRGLGGYVVAPPSYVNEPEPAVGEPYAGTYYWLRPIDLSSGVPQVGG